MNIISSLATIHSVRRFMGVDKAVFYSVLSRSFSVVGSLISIPLILTRLSSVEQGYYYTFGSILALQVFLELGFGTVAIQMIAHEAAHLKINLLSGISGSSSSLARFSATLRFVRNWYKFLSLFVGIFIFFVGAWFFYTSHSSSSVNWRGPWALMSIAAAVGVYSSSLISVIEGSGSVSEAMRIRLFGGMLQIFLTVLWLLVGFKLYAVPLASAIALTFNLFLARRILRKVTEVTQMLGQEIRIDWLKEVLPFQWRIALSWMSGWFISGSMLPVVFRQLGPEEAGRFGLALSVSFFISSVAVNWTSTKSAIWGQMVSRREWRAMDSMFRDAVYRAVGVAAVTSLFALFLVPRLGDWHTRFLGRVPDFDVLFVLCSVAVINQIVFAEAFYLRAHKAEPFLVSSVSLGMAMITALLCFSYTSVLAVSGVYLLVSLSGLVWGSLIFFRCRRIWHSVADSGTDGGESLKSMCGV